MDKLAVVNASPLIFLSRGHHIDLLHNFSRQIYVPEPAAAEIKVKGNQDITAKVLEDIPWLEVTPSKSSAGYYFKLGIRSRRISSSCIGS